MYCENMRKCYYSADEYMQNSIWKALSFSSSFFSCKNKSAFENYEVWYYRNVWYYILILISIDVLFFQQISHFEMKENERG